jgi:hypothetical protein
MQGHLPQPGRLTYKPIPKRWRRCRWCPWWRRTTVNAHGVVTCKRCDVPDTSGASPFGPDDSASA